MKHIYGEFVSPSGTPDSSSSINSFTIPFPRYAMRIKYMAFYVVNPVPTPPISIRADVVDADGSYGPEVWLGSGWIKRVSVATPGGYEKQDYSKIMNLPLPEANYDRQIRLLTKNMHNADVRISYNFIVEEVKK